MTLNGWIQILVFCAIVVALVKPLGWYMTRVFNGERTFLSPLLRPVETVLYRLVRHERAGRTALADLYARPAGLQPARLPRALCPSALPGRAAVQSDGHGRGGARPRLQHRRQLHDQHELAELRRREHHVLSGADGRPDRSELRVGRDRHRHSRSLSFAASRVHRRRASAISGPT